MNDSGEVEGFGDRAGEHLRMERGRFGAWMHVVFAFLLLVVAFTVISMITALIVVAFVAGETPYEQFLSWVGGGCVVAGVVFVWWMFRDRWRCIEAHASRYCSGLANLSVMYVPAIAAIYACVRAGRKLTGRERSHAKPPVVFYAEP